MWTRSLTGACRRDIPIRMVSELPRYLKENDVQIAALTLPRRPRQKAMADLVTENGVKAIWNFAHTDLRASGGCDRGECSSFGQSHAAFLQYEQL